jgi:hypothetical protein
MDQVKARMVQFVFRSAAGKFFRRMGKDQFDHIKMSATRIEFTSNDLEINEEAVNDALQSTQVRLTSGFINSMKGDFPVRTDTTRRVVLDGVHLTMDFIGSCCPAPAAPETAVHPPPLVAAEDREQRTLAAIGRLVSAEDVYSSMVEDREQVKKSKATGVAPGSPESGASEELPGDIDACAAALSSTVKALLHNTVGILRDVNLRLRFPPPNCDIVPGQPLPKDCVEVLVHIPRIDVTDATDVAKAVNNSFRKRIRFSGIMVQMYDAHKRVVRANDSTVTQELDLNNTVMQGDPIDLGNLGDLPTLDDVARLAEEQVLDRAAAAAGHSPKSEQNCLNELDIELNDADPNHPVWRKKLSITQVHAVLSPSQLVRLMRVAHYFGRAPEEAASATTETNADTAAAVAENSGELGHGENKFRCVLSSVSVAILQTEELDAVSNVWHRFNVTGEDPSVVLASWPHYAIRLSHFLLHSANPLEYCAPGDGDADPLLPLFNKVRGSELTVAVSGITVVERQPTASSSTVVLRLAEAPPDLGKSMVISRRTSYAMSIERARHYGVDTGTIVDAYARQHKLDLRDLNRSPQTRISQQHVLFYLGMPLQLYADVEMLDRVLGFSKKLADLTDLAHKAPSNDTPPPSEPSVRGGTTVSRSSARRSRAAESSATGGPMFYSAMSRSQSPSESEQSVGIEDLGDMVQRTDTHLNSGSSSSDLDLCETDSEGEAEAQRAAFRRRQLEDLSSRGGQSTRTQQHRDPVAWGNQRPDESFRERSKSPSVMGPHTIMASAVAVRCQSLSVELLFPTSRPPPPDLYGPDSVRLFSTLARSAVTADPFLGETGATPPTFYASVHDAPTSLLYLPRCLALRCDGVNIDLPEGDIRSMIIAADQVVANFRQLDKGHDVALLVATSQPASEKTHVNFSAAAPTANKAATSVRAAPALGGGRKRPAVPTIHIRQAPEKLSRPLDLEEVEKELAGESAAGMQQDLVTDAAIFVEVRVPYLTTETLLRDHYLLLLYMVTELSDCISGALDRDAERRTATVAQKVEEAFKSSGKKLTTSSIASDDALAHFFSSKNDTITAKASNLPTTVVSVHVQHVVASVRASRLDANGLPVGEPLWTLVPSAITSNTSEALHFHRYKAQLQNLTVFLATQSPTITCSRLVAMIKARAVVLCEVLPPALPDFTPPPTSSLSVPRWGEDVRLLESYASLYNRAHDLNAEELAAQAHVFTTSIRREYNSRRRTDDLDAKITLDRVAVTHQAAHEGDHWLFVLMAFASDAPVPTGAPRPAGSDSGGSESDSDRTQVPSNLKQTMPPTGAEAVDAADAATSARVASERSGSVPATERLQPFLCRSSVDVAVSDVMLEYNGFSRAERIVLLVPSLTLRTGDIVSGSAKMVMQVFIEEPISVMLHDNFIPRILQYDADRGRSSVFGSTRRGVQQDLALLGFVPLATLKHKYTSKQAARKEGKSSTAAAQQSAFNLNMMASQRFNPSTQFVNPEALRSSIDPKASISGAGAPKSLPAVRVLVANYEEKPLVVDIAGLELELSAAWDSFIMLQGIAHHWVSGNDALFLPSPRFLVGSSGSHFQQLRQPLPPPPPPPPKRRPSDAAAPRAFVGGVPILPEALANGEDPLAAMRDDDGDVVRQISDSVFDEYDRITLDEGPVNVSWVPPNYQPPKDQRRAVGRFAGFPGSVDDMGFTEIKALETAHEWPGNFLASLFSAPMHFHRANTAFRRRDMDVPAKPLPNCPRPQLELVISDASVRFLLCGGSDFQAEKKADDVGPGDEEYDLLLSTNFARYFKPDGKCFWRTARNEEDELLVAEFNGVFLQLDVFEPGHNMQQRLHVTAQEVSVLDRIRASPVRQLLWIDIPEAQRDRPAIEFRWTSFAYSSDQQSTGLMELEEDMAIRLLPLHLSLSRVAFDLLAKFLASPDLSGPLASSSERHGASAATSRAPPPATIFFRRFALHPVQLKVSWYPDLRDLSSIWQGDVVELASVLTVEGSSVDLSDIVIHACPANLLPEQLKTSIMPMLYTSKVIFLFAGLQPVRTVTEVAGALSDLVITPLEYLQANKSIYNGIARGLSMCTRRLAGETLRVASSATRAAHEGVHYVAQPAIPHAYADPMLRGNQPEGLKDGVVRGVSSVAQGVTSMGTALRSTFGDSTYDRHTAARIPLSLLLPIDGAFRGLTEILLGARNALQPERRRDEVQEFKSTRFSGAPKKMGQQ